MSFVLARASSSAIVEGLDIATFVGGGGIENDPIGGGGYGMLVGGGGGGIPDTGGAGGSLPADGGTGIEGLPTRVFCLKN